MAKKSKKKGVSNLKTATVKSKKSGKVTPTTSRIKSSPQQPTEPLLFGRQNFILIIAGTLAMALGFILMLGGGMPNPDIWDEGLIYSSTRTVVAPILILGGLVILIFAIFKKSPAVDS